jgi:hypothetical protein
MTTKSTLLTLALLMISSTSAFAAQDRWTEGYGQGNFEYFIDKGNTRLYIGCPTQEGSAVITYNGKTITIPKSNAKKVLPVQGKNWACNLFF